VATLAAALRERAPRCLVRERRAGRREALEYGVDLAEGSECGELVARDAAFAVGGAFAGLDHAEQDGAQELPVCLAEPAVELLGGLGKGSADTA
jgi:hypothetical protein